MLRFAFTWTPVSEMNWRVMLNLELTCGFQVKYRCMCASKIDVTNVFDLNWRPYQRKARAMKFNTQRREQQWKMVEDLWDGQSQQQSSHHLFLRLSLQKVYEIHRIEQIESKWEQRLLSKSELNVIMVKANIRRSCGNPNSGEVRTGDSII